MRLTFDKPTRAQLLAELVAAGFDPATTDVQSTASQCFITVPEGTSQAQQDAIAAVVAAHDAAAIDGLIAADKQQFLADVAGLKQYQQLAAPTLAQTVAATKAQTRLLRRMFQELQGV